jgi:GNAT superfamily N-acetyltransferase
VPGDVQALSELYGECISELAGMRGGPVLMGSGRGSTSEAVRVSFELQLGGPGSMVVVALAAGRQGAVGYASCREYSLDDGTGIVALGELYVLPAYRRQGRGRALARAVVDWGAQRGCTGVDGSALPGNRAVKSFFESEGFTARLLVMHRRID